MTRSHPALEIQINALRSDLIKAHRDSPIRVNENRVRSAIEFLDVLPDHVCTPTMAIALDGELFFMWEDDTKFLTIVPQVDGQLRFAAEFGRERREGVETFVPFILPAVVVEMMDAFQRQDA